jgi:divalent metal cation (Fe/Co/Zn/Cd) transporter
VSAVIFRQGVSLLTDSFGELTDHGVSLQTRHALTRALEPLIQTRSPSSSIPTLHKSDVLLGVRDVRGIRAGATMFVDLIADVPPDMSIHHATSLEERIVKTLKETRKEISEVRVKFNTVDPVQNDQL